jgi:transcription elongation factor GreA
MADEFITKRGLAKLQKELADLRSNKRIEVAGRIRDSLAFGDISENAEYTEAKEEQAFVEGRIAEIENILRHSMVISENNRSSSLVAEIGCTVELASGSQQIKFSLVGKGEGDPTRGEISSDSPLGKAILGRAIGERVRVSTPGGNKHYKIIRLV